MTTPTPTHLARSFAATLNGHLIPKGVKVDVLPGRTYDRIIFTTIDGERSIQGFVKRTDGVLYQPSSWARPSMSHETFDLAADSAGAVDFTLNKN